MKNLIITIVVIILIILGVIWFTSQEEVPVTDEMMDETTEVEGDGEFTTMPAEDEASEDVSEMEVMDTEADVEVEAGL